MATAGGDWMASGACVDGNYIFMSITVTFIQQSGDEQTIQVENLAQSLMEVGRNHSVPGIAADCGGACACATCHVHVDPAWMDAVGPSNPIETEMLDLNTEMTETSRLACQIELREDFDGLRVTVPA